MQHLYLTIEPQVLHVFEKERGRYVPQHIEGRKDYPYSQSSIGTDIEHLLNCLEEIYNLGSKTELTFSVVGTDDPVATKCVVEALGEYAQEFVVIDDLMIHALRHLKKDASLKTEEYGVNYNGCHYRMVNGALQKGPFDLLGYTVSAEKIIPYIE